MEETAIMFRDARALLRHAKKVQLGLREIGNGQDEEEFCVELGISWISWWFQVTLPTTGVSEMSRRKELTAYLSPETISTILSMGSLKKVEIRYLLLSQRTPLSLAESHLLSVSLSNCRNLAHLDLSEKYDTTYEFCLAPHATQLGESLKNLPLEHLKIWGVVKNCSLAIRPLVESSTCRLKVLAFKDKYIPGDNTTDEWCASIEPVIAVLKACEKVSTLKELCVGRLLDVDTTWDEGRQQVQIHGRGEPRREFIDQVGSLLKSRSCPLEKLTMEVHSRVVLLGLFDGLEHNNQLKELKVKDGREHLMSGIDSHTNELQKMRGVMEHNTTLTHLAVDRLGIHTSMNYRRSVERWIQDSSLSAQGRRDHASIHFLCTFNSMGRENFVQAVHDGSGLPSANDLKSNQLIENIGSNKLHLCDSEMHLSCLYELLRANTAIICGASVLPPPGNRLHPRQEKSSLSSLKRRRLN